MSESIIDYSIEYSSLYDILTGHKDYHTEAEYLNNLIKRHSCNTNKLVLSVGCGTGSHELILDSFGINMSCVDTSSAMIEVASRKPFKRSTFSTASINDYSSLHRSEFDVAISLFNVVNCLSDIKGLVEFFSAIALTIKPNGMLFFECWNMIPCVIDPPKVVTRTFSDKKGAYSLVRVATPLLDKSKQRLKIDYECFGKYKDKEVNVRSVHKLTLFSHIEFDYALTKAGFKDIVIGPALADLNQSNFDINKQRMISITAHLND